MASFYFLVEESRINAKRVRAKHYRCKQRISLNIFSSTVHRNINLCWVYRCSKSEPVFAQQITIMKDSSSTIKSKVLVIGIEFYFSKIIVLRAKFKRSEERRVGKECRYGWAPCM